jgi:hypothetical protein
MRGIVIVVLLGACGGGGKGGGGGALTQDELTNACVLFGSCIGGDGVNDCFTDIVPALPPSAMRCIIAAGNDCVASRACLGFTFSMVTSCTERCDGNTIVECEGSTIEFRGDCDSPLSTGPTCFIGNFGRPECGVSTCTVESRTCAGSVAQECDVDTGILGELDCGERNLECANGVCTSPGGGGACTDGTPTHCTGAAIESCSNGTTELFDCPSLISGSTCIAGIEPFCGYGTACVPTKGAETCTGNTLNFCAAGVVGSVDCTSLGFTQCLNGQCVTL